MEMNQKLTVNRRIWAFGVPLFILCFSVTLALSNYAATYPELYAGITYDLILLVPLTFYFLSKGKMSKFIVGLFVSVGIITAFLIIPESEQFHFNLIRYFLLPAIELTIIGSVVYVTYKTISSAKKRTNERTDYLTTFQYSGVKGFGNDFFGKLFGSELAMIHYAFFDWKSNPISENEFSYHKKNGTISLLAGVLMIIVIETIGVHFLLAKWSGTVAWILTILSLYTFIMLFAHLKAITRRPHKLHSDSLELKLGLFGTTVIPFQNIEKIDFTDKISDEIKKSACQFTALGDMESFNTVIELKDKVECEFIYGIKRKYKILLFNIDDKEQFKRKFKKLCTTQCVSNSDFSDKTKA